MVVFARRYDIGHQLGHGGNGTVWHARDLNQQMDVALKVFTPGFPPGLVFREAQQLTVHGGPHVSKVLNADIYNDVPFMAMEIAAGGSVGDHLIAHAPAGVRPDTAVRWGRHLLAGLGASHRSGLLHRDVKPGNVLLESFDTALLGDFGLAERMVGGVAPNLGTLAWKPSESLTTGLMSVRSDVYAAGLTIWEMLTGVHPLLASGPADDAALTGLIHSGVPRLRDMAPHVPRSIATVVEKASSLDPNQRYESAQAMDEAFGRLGDLGRLWTPAVAVAPLTLTWESTAQGAEQYGYEVTATENGGRWQIETRKNGGARQLVRGHCLPDVRDRDLPKKLRAVFDRL